MATSSLSHPYVHVRQRDEHWRVAHPRGTGVATQQITRCRTQRDDDVREILTRKESQIQPIERASEDPENSISIADVVGIMALLVWAVATIAAAAYGAHYILSEFSRYAMVDVMRMLGGMP